MSSPPVQGPAVRANGAPAYYLGRPAHLRITCGAVEQEIAADHQGVGRGSSGVPCLLIAAGLRDQGAGSTATAATALGLLLVRNMIWAIRPFLPTESFEVIKNPIAAPTVLTDFLAR